MNFRQFAINNVVRNKRIYLAHFLSSTFSVMIFFTYALLLFHPDLKEGLKGSSNTVTMLANQGFLIAEIIIFIFSFLFLLYSVGSFLKTRKKEFGIFQIIGMTRKQMNRLLFMENMCIGLAAIVTGVGLGMMFAKLILLICGSMLAVEESLRFYFPGKAIALTVGAFLILFFVIALTSSLLMRKGSLIDLVKSEEKPKPEPKASRLLALLSVILIGGGYAGVFTFVWITFSFPLLVGSVVLVIAGTYLLFTQLSVYAIRALKGNKRLFFRKTNLLFLSELTYRMKDNAVMFFMVSVISASAFTGIGTMLAIADPGLSSMTNPYAFTYQNSWDTSSAERHIRKIEETLIDNEVPYQKGSYIPLTDNEGNYMIKLSEYNHLAKALGYKERTLENTNDSFMTPGNLTSRKALRAEAGEGSSQNNFDLWVGEAHEKVRLTTPETEIVIPAEFTRDVYVVSNELYDKMNKEFKNAIQADENFYFDRKTQFVVTDWMGTRKFAPDLIESIQNDSGSQGYFELSALVLDWLNSKQTNGIILILSGLIGIVFFTFAASFTYFRLYADLERDEEQYRMIGKMGLSRPELRNIVTRQLMLMFFLPIVLAIIHSSVAFVALQQLVDFSVMGYTLRIFLVFASMQILFFLLVRWRYLRNMYAKLI
ncbi:MULTISPECIES: FtsX-like permease family protein [unclassified Paenibacillus]|uniref:FtsX-like permease family protein n=1 Tax=unclassified Paenibacillus TaxID=185978 RepID=UPI0004136D13|nr:MULTISPECIES: ABC transporter permease [unclassified Paenibacillus]KGP78207.1 ABC transporter permease [Paenibacillus sp. MAEPY2]KGP84828.1 ABC transporter permease [Paenibacillus sp. MAEPY1]